MRYAIAFVLSLLLTSCFSPGQRLRFELVGGAVYDTAPSRETANHVDGVVAYGVRWLEPGKHARLWVESRDIYPVPDGPAPTSPVLITRMALSVPRGWKVWAADQYRIKQALDPFTGGPYVYDGEEVWIAIDGATIFHPHSRVPGSSTAFYIAGGTRLWIDIHAPGYDPYAPPLDAAGGAPDPESPAGKFASFVAMGDPSPEGFSRLPQQVQDAWRFWRFRAEPTSPYCLSDWIWGWPARTAWMANPYQRYLPSRFSWDAKFGEPAGGLYGLLWLGCHPWGGMLADGNHYEGVTKPLQGYIWTRDPGAWNAAVILWRRHMMTFMVLDYSGAQPLALDCYEKTGGSERYPGDQQKPGQLSHTWTANILPMAKILDDPMALEIVQAQYRRILAKTFRPHEIWDAAWGSRLAAWTLRNLRLYHHYGYTGALGGMDRLIAHVFATQARYGGVSAREIEQARQDVANGVERAAERLANMEAGTKHWENRGVQAAACAPWQDAILNSELIASMSTGASRAHWDDLMGICRWEIQRFVSVDAEGMARIVFDAPDVFSPWLDVHRYQQTEAAWWGSLVYLMAQLEPANYAGTWEAIKRTFFSTASYTVEDAVGGGTAATKSWLSEGTYMLSGIQHGL